MNAEHLTAPEFLDAESRAARNGADKPSFKRLLKDLQQFPETRQRLAFEFLAMAWRTVILKGGSVGRFLRQIGREAEVIGIRLLAGEDHLAIF